MPSNNLLCLPYGVISEQQQGSFIIPVLLLRARVMHDQLLSLRVNRVTEALNAEQWDLDGLSHGVTKAADWKGLPAYQRV